jgi:hypothetical protein
MYGTPAVWSRVILVISTSIPTPIPIHVVRRLSRRFPETTRVVCLGVSRERGCDDESTKYLDALVRLRDTVHDRDILVFMHEHDTSWHHSTPQRKRLDALVTTPYFQASSFGGIFCRHNDHFAPEEFLNTHARSTEWHSDPQMRGASLWASIFRATPMERRFPRAWLYPCCGTFFVSGAAVRSRPASLYATVSRNLKRECGSIGTEHSPYRSADRGGVRIIGRAMESAWQVLLANRTAVPLPPDCSPSTDIVKASAV